MMYNILANKNKLYLLLATLTFLVLLTQIVSKSRRLQGGGSEVGNGGQVIMCEKVDQTTYELYDRNEVLFYNPQWELAEPMSSSPTVDQALDAFIKNLKIIDPQRSQKYQKWWQSFWSETNRVTDSSNLKVKKTNDSYSGLRPSEDECKIINVAFQHTKKFYDRYIIVDEIFTKLSTSDQSLLIIHELIYRDYIESGISEDSRNIRYLTTYLTSKSFFDLTNASDLTKASAFYLRTLEEQRLIMPWKHETIVNYIKKLYQTVLQRAPETSVAVNYWAKQCHKHGPQHLLIKFINSNESLKKNITPEQVIHIIKRIMDDKKIHTKIITKWKKEFLTNKKEANKNLINTLVLPNLSCFDFISSIPVSD